MLFHCKRYLALLLLFSFSAHGQSITINAGGDFVWRHTVPNASLLPIIGNVDGFESTALDTKGLYVYDVGSNSWLLQASPAAATAVTALTGDIHATGPGAVISTIQANVVDNTKLAQMPTLTIKGNNTALTANAIDLTVSQIFTLLGLDTAATKAIAYFQAALGFTPENVANKATSLASPDDTKYPTTLAVS